MIRLGCFVALLATGCGTEEPEIPYRIELHVRDEVVAYVEGERIDSPYVVELTFSDLDEARAYPGFEALAVYPQGERLVRIARLSCGLEDVVEAATQWSLSYDGDGQGLVVGSNGYCRDAAGTEEAWITD